MKLNISFVFVLFLLTPYIKADQEQADVSQAEDSPPTEKKKTYTWPVILGIGCGCVGILTFAYKKNLIGNKTAASDHGCSYTPSKSDNFTEVSLTQTPDINNDPEFPWFAIALMQKANGFDQANTVTYNNARITKAFNEFNKKAIQKSLAFLFARGYGTAQTPSDDKTLHKAFAKTMCFHVLMKQTNSRGHDDTPLYSTEYRVESCNHSKDFNTLETTIPLLEPTQEKLVEIFLKYAAFFGEGCGYEDNGETRQCHESLETAGLLYLKDLFRRSEDPEASAKQKAMAAHVLHLSLNVLQSEGTNTTVQKINTDLSEDGYEIITKDGKKTLKKTSL